MKYITKEVRIGIAGIAALCILVYGINYLKGIHMFKPSSYFYVKFHNVNGLTKSSPVFADGFRVGIVRDLYYDYTQPGKVVAEIDVNTDLILLAGIVGKKKMLTDKLNRKDNTVGLLLNDPSLYNNLNATTANAASLLEDLKSHPKRYVHFSLFGKKDK